MAVEPKTIRETNIAMEGIEGRLGILSKMIWTVVGLLGTLLIAAFALYSQLGDIKTDLAVLKSTVGVIGDRQAKIEESVRSLESKALASLNRIETRLLPTGTLALAPLDLEPDQIAFLRDALKPRRTDKPTLAKIGNLFADSKFPYVPDYIVEKIPKLKGLRYTYDQSGAILLLAGGGWVVQIIEPS
jgi:hypothetical protein